MKIATWNLDQLAPDAARTVWQRKHIDRIKADVWVFTETHHDFAPGPGYECIACSTAVPDIPQNGRWVAIWSRLPAEVVNLTADLERVAAVRLKDNGAVIVGTVLPWNSDKRDPEISGSAAFQMRLAEQAADWARLQEECAGRLCVAGDFNQDLLPSKHYYGSGDGKQALWAALDACSLRCLTGGEVDPLKDVPARASIDHICIGEGLQAKKQPETWIEPGMVLKPKEHYGVWVELEAD